MKAIIPMRTVPGMNTREHPMGRHRRVKREKRDTLLCLTQANGGNPRPPPPYSVRLTRIAPRGTMDDDNLQSALKAVRDAVAQWLKVDDGDQDRVRFEYDQRRGAWAVEVELLGAMP